MDTQPCYWNWRVYAGFAGLKEWGLRKAISILLQLRSYRMPIFTFIQLDSPCVWEFCCGSRETLEQMTGYRYCNMFHRVRYAKNVAQMFRQANRMY